MFIRLGRQITVLLMVLIGAAVFLAPAAAQAQGKIGVVDINRAVRECAQGKKALSALQQRAQKLESELKSLQAEMEALRKDLENTAMLLKPEARLSKERDFERMVRQFRDRQRDAKQEMAEAERDAFNPILKKLAEIIKQIGAKENYALITEAKAAFYYPQSADITAKVIAAYDQANP